MAFRSLPLRIRVLVEDRRMGRGGALKRAAAYLPFSTEPWLATYGDIWTRFPLHEMTAYHCDHGLATTEMARQALDLASAPYQAS